MPARRPRTRSFGRPLVGLALCIAASIGLCAPVLNVSLVSDDWVLLDALVTKGIWGAWGSGGHEMLGFFRPFVTLSLWVNFHTGGLNPLPYHLFNATVHGITAWLVGMIVWFLISDLRHSLSPQSSVLNPILASAIFLIHPSHAEPVAWVSGRADLIACAFALASLAIWIYASRIRSGLGALSMICFVLALMAKESAITLPFMILAYELILNSRGGPLPRLTASIRRCWPFFAILVLFLILRTLALGHAVGGYGSGRILAANPLFWARNLIVSMVRCFLPAIPSPGFGHIGGIVFAAGVIASIIALAIILKAAARFSPKVWALLIFFATALVFALIPVINLPVSLRTSEGERFVYLASAFAAMALSLLLSCIMRQNAKTAAATILLIVYFIGIEASFSVWREAGHLTGNLISDLNRFSAKGPFKEVDVYGLPDHLRGAYVFRNGFIEAAKLNGITPARIKKLDLSGISPIDSVSDKIIWGLCCSAGSHTLYYSGGRLYEYGT